MCAALNCDNCFFFSCKTLAATAYVLLKCLSIQLRAEKRRKNTEFILIVSSVQCDEFLKWIRILIFIYDVARMFIEHRWKENKIKTIEKFWFCEIIYLVSTFKWNVQL